MRRIAYQPNKKLLLVALFNLVIVVAEYIGGVLSGSLALLSDAGHNLTDVIALLVAFVGERLTHKKTTRHNSFGFKRFEVFTSLFNAFILCAIALFILFGAIHRAVYPQHVDPFILVSVALVGLVANFFSVFVLYKERNKNLNLKTAYLNLFYDTLSSVFIIVIGVIIFFTNFTILDTVISVAISIMLLWSGFTIIRKAVHILMQGIPEGIDFEKVHDDLLSLNGIHSLHDLHIWCVNSSDFFLSCHACLEKMKNQNPDRMIEKMNLLLSQRYGIHHSAIQLEFSSKSKR